MRLLEQDTKMRMELEMKLDKQQQEVRFSIG
jgi:hypothetical protein